MDRSRLIKDLERARREIEPGQDVEVGPFEPGDAKGVSLCYYEIYGESFPIDHVYDPEAVILRNATDEQYTIVARTPKKEIVGMAGLFRHAPNPEVYEAGQLMVLKAFRNGSLSTELARRILGDFIHALDLSVVFTEAVCNHPVSQRLALEQGHHATGLELECMPSPAYSKERSGLRNVSLLLTFDVRKDQGHVVHLPDPYTGFLEKMYGDLGLERTPAEGGDFSGITESDEFSLPEAGFVRITLQRAGTDFQDVVERAEADAGKQGLVQVYINLGDSAAPGAVAHLRDRGYFLGGLLPLWFGTDGLIMQKLPQPPAWDELQLHGRATRDLVAFIRKDHGRVNPDR